MSTFEAIPVFSIWKKQSRYIREVSFARFEHESLPGQAIQCNSLSCFHMFIILRDRLFFMIWMGLKRKLWGTVKILVAFRGVTEKLLDTGVVVSDSEKISRPFERDLGRVQHFSGKW